MGEMMNMPWLSKDVEVVESTDPTLVGVIGTVVDETKGTIRISNSSGTITMAKNTIRFRIDDEEIEGSRVRQRPEERIGKRYRRP
ncbi:MAG: hypothetical protein CMB67_04800 [Euryarchaeota archaeon]|nr:hypothetical protein [Euryarchaeota archaeon]